MVVLMPPWILRKKGQIGETHIDTSGFPKLCNHNHLLDFSTRNGSNAILKVFSLF
jgi:hypothetical protein